MSQYQVRGAGNDREINIVVADVNGRSEIKGGGRATLQPTSPDDFQTAAIAAERFHAQDWHTMSCREQAMAIYAELQKLDTERARAMLSGRRTLSIIDTNE